MDTATRRSTVPAADKSVSTDAGRQYPHEVAIALYASFTAPPVSQDGQWLHQSLWHSIQIIFWGFVISSIIGVPLGVLCGTYASGIIRPIALAVLRFRSDPAGQWSDHRSEMIPGIW